MRLQNIGNGYMNSNSRSNLQAPAFGQTLAQVLVHTADNVRIFRPLEEKVGQATESHLVIDGRKIVPGDTFLLKQGTEAPVTRVFKGAYLSLTELGDRCRPTNRIMHTDINGRELTEFTTDPDAPVQTELFLA